MDIVGEKTNDSKHDFSKDPLELRIVDDFYICYKHYFRWR